MTIVFADTCYWVALLNPKDAWYEAAIAIGTSLSPLKIITTDEVLTEVLTSYCNAGFRMRKRSTDLVHDVLNNTKTQVLEQTHTSFLSGLSLYQNRLDKGYSLTDCISMQTMRQLGITEVLTHDKHFTQEGFVILLTD